MQPISIFSCEKCNPLAWEIIGIASSDHYKCKCGTRTDKILRNRFYVPPEPEILKPETKAERWKKELAQYRFNLEKKGVI